jgi:hypothetical protein
MAMRWQWCRALIPLLLITVSCVKKVTRYYVPSPGNPTFSVDEAGNALLPFVRIHCGEADRIKQKATGEAKIELLVGPDGRTTRAELKSGTGNDALDGLFGTFAAQLTFPPPSHQRELTRTVQMQYACSEVVVATVRLQP